ncbi:MAG: Na(+)/H(+) antiporter subunit B [Planctomycetota bacterium]
MSAARKKPEPKREPLASQEVLTVSTNLMVPFIVVFGVYVITHGELGPGGGFQGGVIIAAAYILYALVHGSAAARAIVPRWVTDLCAPLGVAIYGGTGALSLFAGKTFLDYDVLDRVWPGHGQGLGMTVVELGVGLTVASVMVTVFSEIAARDEAS